jgi:nucleoside-diphosphate-sugar epimerase
MKILVTGSTGFIAGYLVEELLGRGREVVGIDNFYKYGKMEKSYDGNPGYALQDRQMGAQIPEVVFLDRRKKDQGA